MLIIGVLFLCLQLQQLVVSGELPCSKEEAATLAGIHLHLDETWPEEQEVESGQTEDNDEREQDRLLKLDKNDGKTKRKEILLQNRTKKFASNRRKRKLVKQLSCFGEEETLFCMRGVDGRMSSCLPPDFRTSRTIRDLIEVRG